MRRMIPNSLRTHRKKSGLNQLEVAKHLGLESTNRISRWESGEAFPSVMNLIKMSVLYSTCANKLYLDLVLETKQDLILIANV